MDEKLKRQLIGGGVLLVLLVIVIKWLGGGGVEPADHPDAMPAPDGRRETRVYDLAQLDAEGKPRARAVSPDPAQDTAEDAAEGVPPVPAPKAKAAPAALSEPVLAPPAHKPAAPKPAAKPAPKPAQKTASVPAPATGDWVIQVGSYSNEGNARTLETRLRGEGYATVMDEASLEGKKLYRLRVGPYADEAAARTAAAKLETLLGQKVSVLRD